MRIHEIAFSIEKTTPLQPLTRNEDDRYANVKPCAHVVIGLSEGDSIDDAFTLARETCLTELVRFHEQITRELA